MTVINEVDQWLLLMKSTNDLLTKSTNDLLTKSTNDCY